MSKEWPGAGLQESLSQVRDTAGSVNTEQASSVVQAKRADAAAAQAQSLPPALGKAPSLVDASDEDLDQMVRAGMGQVPQTAALLGQVAGASSPILAAGVAGVQAASALQAGDLSGAVPASSALGQALGASAATMAAVGAASQLAAKFASSSGGVSGTSAAAAAAAPAPTFATVQPPAQASPEAFEPAPPVRFPAALEPPTSPAIPPADRSQLSQPPQFDDRQRLFRLSSPLSGERRLFLDTLAGSEALNEPFAFTLGLASLNGNIELKDALSQPMTVGIQQADGSERYLNGYVATFAFESTNGGWASYSAQLVSWLHFLSLRINARIFQDCSIPEIVERVFAEYGAAANFEFRLRGAYAPQDFIVQYQESDLNFVSRLMEKEGWSYYFVHSSTAHKLIVTDDTTIAGYCPPLDVYDTIEFNGGDRVCEEHSVSSLRAERRLQPAKISLATFDYLNPLDRMGVAMPTIAKQGDVPEIEVYDGTPGYAYASQAEGERYARLRMETFEARTKYFEGDSDCPDLAPGRTTVLRGHEWFPDQTPLLITRVTHEGRNNLDLGREHSGKESQTAHYANRFECLRATVPHRPELVHPKPTIPGLQTATVTAPPGEEIWTNKHGCIKVHFHWDRLGKYDQSSSCWVRVAQAWAGQGWGTVAIPRAGQEVVVGFMGGDPDRPLVLGSVFNAVQAPPYALPAGNHMMGFKSNSTGRKGGHSEMVIHDQGGNERVNIRSQKDMETTVLNDATTTIHNNQSVTVDGTRDVTVKKKITVASTEDEIEISAATKISIRVGKSSLVMDKDGNIKINGVNIATLASEQHTLRGSRIDLN